MKESNLYVKKIESTTLTRYSEQVKEEFSIVYITFKKFLDDVGIWRQQQQQQQIIQIIEESNSYRPLLLPCF